MDIKVYEVIKRNGISVGVEFHINDQTFHRIHDEVLHLGVRVGPIVPEHNDKFAYNVLFEGSVVSTSTRHKK